MTGKWDLKKDALYRPSAGVPQIVEIPEYRCAAVSGTGNPNTSEEYAQSLEALYGLSYAVKMMPKKGVVPAGYFEYAVPPLEGFWDMATEKDFDASRKDELAWTMLIRQPSFVDADLFERARLQASEKKGRGGNPKFADLRFESLTEGLCCQILHVGPFDDEPASFSLMADFLAAEGYERTAKSHHEIYLSDYRKTAPEKLRTILRAGIRKKDR